MKLIEELGALGWRCKGTPPHCWPPDTLSSARSLLAALLPHLADLPADSLAHCCWALAQLGEAGGSDPGLVGFVAAVQLQLLAPVPHPYDNGHSDGAPSDSARVGHGVLDGAVWPPGDPLRGGSSTHRGGPGVRSGAAGVGINQAEHGRPAGSGLVDGPGAVHPRDGGVGTATDLAPPEVPLPTHGTVPAPLAGAPHPPTCLTRMAPKELSKLAWALAKLGIRPDAVVAGWDVAGPTAGCSTAAAIVGGGQPGTSGAAAVSGSGSGSGSGGAPRTAAAAAAAAASAGEWRRLQLRWWRELGLAAAAAIRRVEMPPQAVCNTLWGFATCGQTHRELLRAAAECIAGGHRTRYEPVGVANLLWAFSTLGFFNPTGGRRGRGDDLYDRLYDMLVRLTQPLVGAMTMQNLSNVAWALVTARRHERQPAARQLLGAVCARATEIVSAAAGSAAAAETAVALPDEPFPPSAAAAAAGLHDDGGVGVGGLAGLAAAEEEAELGGGAVVRPPSVMDVQRYDPHSASVLAWSLAQAAPPGHPRIVSYLDAVVAAALAVQPGLVSYSDQDLAMLLLAHFRTRHYSAALVRGVRQEVLRRLERGMEPHALTNICYCLATSNYYNDELYDAVAASAARLLERFGPALASRLVWSLGRARHYNPRLLAAFATYIRPRLSECSPADLVASATALAQFHHYDAPLLQGLAAEALARTAPPPPLRRPPSPSTSSSTSTSSSSKQGSATDVPTDAAAAQPRARRAQPAADGASPGGSSSGGSSAAAGGPSPLPPRALVNLLWCFAVLSHVDEALLGALLERLRGVDIDRLGVPAVMQLCQAQVMLQDLYGGIIKPPEVLTPKQMEVARSTWQRVSAGATTVSRLQRDVVACLRRLGAQPRCERVTLDGLFSIDTSLEWGGRRVAVEVDGPSHFTCSRPFRPLGRTLAKRRCLEMRGWRVLSVPGHEWRALGGDPGTEERYMVAALEGVLWRTHVLEGLA